MRSGLNPIERKIRDACVASMNFPNSVWYVMAKGTNIKTTSADFMMLSYKGKGYKIMAKVKGGEEI